ncbi:hypothetical protein KC354_g35 [Hortaea werneckii]|nr:hypothetical protein KC354_g35 [Hortaea werneckii]
MSHNLTLNGRERRERIIDVSPFIVALGREKGPLPRAVACHSPVFDVLLEGAYRGGTVRDRAACLVQTSCWYRRRCRQCAVENKTFRELTATIGGVHTRPQIIKGLCSSFHDVGLGCSPFIDLVLTLDVEAVPSRAPVPYNDEVVVIECIVVGACQKVRHQCIDRDVGRCTGEYRATPVGTELLSNTDMGIANGSHGPRLPDRGWTADGGDTLDDSVALFTASIWSSSRLKAFATPITKPLRTRRIVLQLDFDQKLDTVYQLNKRFERWTFENSSNIRATAKDVLNNDTFKQNWFRLDRHFELRVGLGTQATIKVEQPIIRNAQVDNVETRSIRTIRSAGVNYCLPGYGISLDLLGVAGENRLEWLLIIELQLLFNTHAESVFSEFQRRWMRQSLDLWNKLTVCSKAPYDPSWAS